VILIGKYEPQVSIDEAFIQCIHAHEELCKIYEFIDLPESIRDLERQNSAILRNYYANALDHNLVDIKTVKYVLSRNIKPNGMNELAVEQYGKAEQYLASHLDEALSVSMVYRLHQLLVTNLYNGGAEANLFNSQGLRMPEKLNMETEYELESLFEFLNHDSEFHPLIQSWILHFRIIGMELFAEGRTKIAALLQNFWLQKHNMDMFGLLSLEHELYIHKNTYRKYFSAPDAGADAGLNDQMAFGLQMHMMQLQRLKQMLRSYFCKQVDFDKLNPRQKNVMNYVFNRGYRLKEIDDAILNKRQKLIMYIIQHRGFISTKDLVNEFDCNRKTIQRDFTALLSMGLVKSIGAGAGLRYCINLKEKQNPQLEKYQADFVKAFDAPVQNELFADYSSSAL
jgi:Fic family protein